MPLFSQPETAPEPVRLAYRPPAQARKLLVSMNPRAGFRARHGHVERITQQIERAGFHVQQVTDLDSLRTTAAILQRAGELRAVIAVGGDGTASIVRRHVPLEVPLLVVPMGTENLLGRFVRQSIEPVSVLDVVENGVVVELDLGWANGQPFLLMISAGFDAEVVRALHERRRGNIHRVSYILPAIYAIQRYQYEPIRVYWGDRDDAGPPTSMPKQCRWLFGFNLPLYAIGLSIAPKAIATDGLLDVCMFERGRLWGVVRYLWHVVWRTHMCLPDAALRQAKRFRLEPLNDGATVAYQLDGDFGGMLPVDVEVTPRQLRLLVSAETAVRLGFQWTDNTRNSKPT